jgi:hypothetical protein
MAVAVLSIVIVGATIFFYSNIHWIGIVFIAIGILHIAALQFMDDDVRNSYPDIAFGVIDNGVLAIGAIVGADFGGVLGAIVGSAAANAVTDGLAGVFEGGVAEKLRKRGISDKRTLFRSAVGKMGGCMLGAGVVFLVAWALLP